MSTRYDYYCSAAWRPEDGSELSRFQDLLVQAFNARLTQMLGRPSRTAHIRDNTPWSEILIAIEQSCVLLRCVTHYSQINQCTLGELSHWRTSRRSNHVFNAHLFEDLLSADRSNGGLNLFDFTPWRQWLQERTHWAPSQGPVAFHDAIQALSHAVAGVVIAQPATHSSIAPESVSSHEKSLRIFLSHVSEDKELVRGLYVALRNSGYKPWLDEYALVPGQDWREEIERAVRNADVVVVCCSRRSLNKEGVFQREIRYALDTVEELPEGRAFIIPVRLDDGPIPVRLTKWQWVNLFAPDGMYRLLSGLEAISPRR